MQITDRAQEAVGRGGLRIDQAMQPESVLQRQHDRGGPIRLPRTFPPGLLRSGLDDIGDQLACGGLGRGGTTFGAASATPPDDAQQSKIEAIAVNLLLDSFVLLLFIMLVLESKRYAIIDRSNYSA